MSHISISKIANKFKNRPLNVRSLTGTMSNKVDLSLDDLIDPDRKERGEVQKVYRIVLKNALEDIKLANERRHKDVFVIIPERSIETDLYSQSECTEYLEKNLKNLHVDTCRVKKGVLFVTWFNIKNNIFKKDKTG